MADDLLFEEELLLQVAGRSRPSAKPQGKKRNRRAVSISEDDGDYDEEFKSDSDEEDEEAPSQEKGRRSSAVQNKKSRSAPQEQDQVSDGDEFDDGYGSDLMGDEEDRANLMGMNELQREMILAERAEKRDMERERLRNAKLLRQHQQASQQTLQPRASTRAKTQTGSAKKSAMAELVAAKAARAERTTALDRERRRRGRDSSYSEEEEEARLSDTDNDRSARSSPERSSPERRAHSDDSDDDDRRRSRRYSRSESDSDEDARSQEGDEAEEASMEEALRMQVRRSVLEKWLNEPFLEKTVVGCLVRVSMRGAYILAEILGVVEREAGSYKDPGYTFKSPYQTPEGHQTNKWLLLQHGTFQRYMPIALVSNNKFNEEEWSKWHKQCEKDHRPQLSTADVQASVARFKQALTYTYTAEDVQRMIEEKRARGTSGRNSAVEKARLERLRDAAMDKDDLEEAQRLAEQIAELEAAAAEKAAERPNGGMASVNRRNANRNFENAFKNVGARPDGAKLAADGVDPFSRRKTRPMNYWTTKRTQAAPNGAGEGLLIATSSRGGIGEDGQPETPAVAAQATENEQGDLDLNIDLSVLKMATLRKSLASQLLGPNWQISSCVHAKPPNLVARKMLTMADYKRRQGLA